MNDKLETIKATKVTKHTGNVWGAEFPYPTPKFLENFGWKGSRGEVWAELEWEAYGLRKRAQKLADIPAPQPASTRTSATIRSPLPARQTALARAGVACGSVRCIRSPTTSRRCSRWMMRG